MTLGISRTVAGGALGAILLAGPLGLFAAAGEHTVADLAKRTHFHGIAVDAADSSRIFLATHHGLYVASQDGKTRLISEVRDYMGFTAHPADASILFASGHPAGGGNLGFIVSRDGGRTWTKLSDGLDGPVDFHQMDVSKADPRVIYGVYGSLQRSADGGKTWERVGPPPQDLIALAASSADANTIFAATRNGLLRSTDGGRTWKREFDGPTTSVHVTADGTVYAFIAGKGLVRTAEKNPGWRLIGGGLGEEFLLHIAVDPADAQRLYAVAYNSRSGNQSVVVSRNGGERWSKFGGE
jgi:photosystem II stability/assembly factor-like uncharacterized protein